MSRRLRIVDVAALCGLSRSEISRIERGESRGTAVIHYDRIAGALGATAEIFIRYRGANLDRLVNAAHSAMHERVGRLFARLPGWIALPEVTFAIGRELGSIDWLAWHAQSRSLLIVEIKTSLVDVQGLLAQMDRYLRLAREIASQHGWQPATISFWLLFEDSTRNRNAVRLHRSLLATRLPAAGHAMRHWLRMPAGQIRALSFLSDSRGKGVRHKRIRLRASEVAARSRQMAYVPGGGNRAEHSSDAAHTSRGTGN
jgi:transcriptional regulator with XRE-family HTH domain